MAPRKATQSWILFFTLHLPGNLQLCKSDECPYMKWGVSSGSLWIKNGKDLYWKVMFWFIEGLFSNSCSKNTDHGGSTAWWASVIDSEKSFLFGNVSCCGSGFLWFTFDEIIQVSYRHNKNVSPKNIFKSRLGNGHQVISR